MVTYTWIWNVVGITKVTFNMSIAPNGGSNGGRSVRYAELMSSFLAIEILYFFSLKIYFFYSMGIILNLANIDVV